MKVKNLSFSYHQNPFIENLNIEFKENQITTIMDRMVVVNRLYLCY